MLSMVEIDRGVPFGDDIYWWLKTRRGEGLENLEKLSSQFERRFLAWEEVRHGRNPYFVTGTGFEGYFVGSCQSPEQALNEILRLGREMQGNLVKLHRYDHRFQSRLFKTLQGELGDLKAMSEWSAELGATLARLRCKLLGNRQAEAFHNETYRLVETLPSISYMEAGHTIKQHYAVVAHPTQGPKIVVELGILKPTDQDAWVIAKSVGRFGHPFVREFMGLMVG